MNILLRNRPSLQIKFIRHVSWVNTKQERKNRKTWVTTKQKSSSLFSNDITKSYSINKKVTHPELQYLNLVDDIIKNGIKDETRNGVAKSIIGAQMRFPLNDNQIPLLTTKKMAWKSCLKELLWFISGDTDNRTLKKQDVSIWNDNGSRKFLDSRYLNHYREDDLGPIYGYQWRFYNSHYVPLHMFPYTKINDVKHKYNNGIDQLGNIIQQLKNPKLRHSRRMIMTAWNPEQLDQMALPPCHVLSQFHVLGNKLYCTMYQRSGDVGLGIPFNIASYSFLTILLAHHCGLEPGEFIHFIGNAHIYEEHECALQKQTKRKPKQFPTCTIKNKYDNINDYVFSDFNILNYEYSPIIKMKMIA